MAGLYGRCWQPTRAAGAAEADAMRASMTHHEPADHTCVSGEGWHAGAIGPAGSLHHHALRGGAQVTVAGTILFPKRRDGDAAQAFEELAGLLEKDSAQIARWFDRVDGCFALSLVDPSRGKLLLVNDRYGGIPIYTRASSSGLAWASEVKALTQQAPGSLDRTAIAAFLENGWLPPPRTFFRDVSQIEGGTALLADLSTGVATAIPVHAPPRVEPRTDLSFEEAKATFKDVLGHAIRSRVAQSRSDDVVVTLSGGLDSRLLAAEARAYANVRAVTYGQPRSPEIGIASQVARQLGIPHAVIPVDESNWMEGRDRAIWMTDGMMSITDTHIVHVAKAIAGACLVLDGLFGDVVLGRGEITVDPAADVFTNRYLRMNRFTYFGPRIEQNYAPVSTPLIDRELVRFMDGLPRAFTDGGRLYREASGEMHPEVYAGIPWLKTGAYPYPYRQQRLSTAIAKVDRRISQLAGWVGVPFLGQRFTMDYFGWFRGASFQNLYRRLVDGNDAMLRDFAPVPSTDALFSRLPSMERLQSIGRLLTMEVWLRQTAAGRALSWEEMASPQ